MFTGYELLALFFIYSFVGWVMETVGAAVRQKRFVNRGLVNAPMCIIYGIGAVLITLFGQELSGIWIFVGIYILTTMIEWTAGHLIERLYHERWWDYSDVKWNLDGYVCLPYSILWTSLGIFTMKWGNPLFFYLFGLVPDAALRILVGILSIILILDTAATLILLSGRSRRIVRWEAVDTWLDGISSELGKRIYEKIDVRIRRAYPGTAALNRQECKPEIFGYGCSFYKIVWLFVTGAFLGDIVETLFCRVKAGVWMSRSSVVWGPFSLVWGIGIAMITALFYRYRDKTDRFLFGLGTFLGGAYEYICSVFTEIVFGKVFWDYSQIPFNLGGRINLLYCFFWGIAAVVWFKVLLPKVEYWIEKVPVKIGKIITWCMVVFMSANVLVSCMALVRSTERANGIPAQSGWQQVMDERFGNERMKKIYPNMMSVQ